MKLKIIFLLSTMACLIISCGTKDDDVSIVEENVTKTYGNHVFLDSQSKLDAFAANNYDEIIGNIVLTGLSITSATDLKSIKFISGDILVMGTNLENLDGLANTNVSDDSILEINSNQKLTSLNGLSSISKRLKRLVIKGNPLIKDLEGLKNITHVTTEIFLSDTKELTSLNGLSGISSEVFFVQIRDNSALVDTEGLRNIPKIEHLHFINNSALISISNMSSLTEVIVLGISRNASLENINGLSELKTCSTLRIHHNNSLKNLDGLIKLSKVDNGMMGITNNTSLRDFCGLSLIATVSSANYFNIEFNYYNPTKNDIKAGNCSI
ncbi:hypothetical protein [Gelidibacter pelagius]|uniref:Receptor L domain-containing protein n=1 Tax=Gelidibacter pelagius TaxID=2819985 RepID=A0ABS3SW76_9FLAO|nr:hypothetical protein [Gelidibacter pelagius]MBO3099963.1 hypothetical protein [Gelidibacter pelagius]